MHKNIYLNRGYLVTYMSGCSGQFLRLIISMFLSDKVFEVKNFNLGSVTGEVLFEHYITFKDDTYQPNISFIHQDFKVFRDYPFSFAEHPVTDWEKLFKVFPNSINIIIAMDRNMLKRHLLNMEIKNKKVPSTEIEYLKDHIRKSIEMMPECEFYYPMDVSHEYPKEYNIVKLPYYDIIHKKDSVLSMLSSITGKPIKDHVVRTYDNYLAAQHALYPWFDDSVTS